MLFFFKRTYLINIHVYANLIHFNTSPLTALCTYTKESHTKDSSELV